MDMQPQLRSATSELRAQGQWTLARQAQASAFKPSSYNLSLKCLIVALFLPEGFSFFIGDFRLSVARVLIIVLTIQATVQYFQKFAKAAFQPSDLFAVAAGLWMIIAPVIVQGADGLKGGGIIALEFSGTYWIFRHLLGPVDSSVRVVEFAIKLVFLIVALGLLDVFTGKLFTYESAKALTGYSKETFEWAKEVHSETMYRGGFVRAMGPLEHSILFGAVCAWFGTLAICTFPSRVLGWSVAGTAFLGIVVSQAQGPFVAYALSVALVAYYYVTNRFFARWKVLGALGLFGAVFIFVFSSNPVATLLGLGGINPESGWYREAIWRAVVPLVLQSPILGMGVSGEWDWQASGELVGASVDSMWLRVAMTLGIPGSLLVLFTMISAYWNGPLDRSHYLSREERRLSVALGIVTVAAVFLGFTVHFWGTCWILLGVFAGMRANLAEAAVCRIEPLRY
jgi:O-antigen ligase